MLIAIDAFRYACEVNYDCFIHGKTYSYVHRNTITLDKCLDSCQNSQDCKVVQI